MDGGTVRVQRAVPQDEEAIVELIGQRKNGLHRQFGQFDVLELIESSVLSIVLHNENGQMVGFASFMDAPAFGAEYAELQSDKWTQWFYETFEDTDIAVHSCVWMTMFVADLEWQAEVVHTTLTAVFATLQQIATVLAVLPVAVPLYCPIEESFVRMSQTVANYRGPRVYACSRDKFSAKLHIRRACIEDHDDLVPIFNEQSEVITEKFGQFFLAELIEAQSENNHVLVAEVDDRAVGLINVTDQIDTRILRRCFDLSSYNFLKKQKVVVEEEVKDEVEVEATPVVLLPISERLVKMFHMFAETEIRSKERTAQWERERVAGIKAASGEGDIDDDAAKEAADIKALEKIVSEKPKRMDLPAEEESKKVKLAMDLVQSMLQDFVNQLTLSVVELTPEEKTWPDKEKLLAQRLHEIKDEALEMVLKMFDPSKFATCDEESFVFDMTTFGATMTPPLLIDVVEYAEARILTLKQAEDDREAADLAAKETARRALEENIEEEEAALAAAAAKLKELDENEGLLDDNDDEEIQNNVFCITAYCIDQRFESRAVELLAPVFKLFPDRDYCVLTLPHSCAEHPLFSIFNFIPCRPNSSFPHALYLLHRDSVHSAVNVQWATYADATDVLALVGSLPNAQQIMDMFDLFVGDLGFHQAIQHEISKHNDSQSQALANSNEEGGPILAPSSSAGSLPSSSHAVSAACFAVWCGDSLVGMVMLHALKSSQVRSMRRLFALEEFVSYPNADGSSDSTGFERGHDLGAGGLDPTDPNQASLRYFILNPLFQNHSKFVLRECMRLHNKKCITYQVYPHCYIQNVLNDFVQVKPRRKLSEPAGVRTGLLEHCLTSPSAALPTRKEVEAAKEAALSEGLGAGGGGGGGHNEDMGGAGGVSGQYYALHVITRSMIHQPKTTINARIVVVGASNTGLAVLQTLLLQPELNYSSLTLLSRGGLMGGGEGGGGGGGADDSMSPHQFLAQSMCFDTRARQQLFFPFRVRILSDTLTDLDCERKIVVLSDGSHVPYDYLVLCPGLQDPLAIKHVLSGGDDGKGTGLKGDAYEQWLVEQTLAAEGAYSGKGGPYDDEEEGEHGLNNNAVGNSTPTSSPDSTAIAGVFGMSNEGSVTTFLKFLETRRPQPIVVYGCTLKAVCAIRGLLQVGTPSAAIIWVFPEKASSGAWCDGDALIQSRVLKVIKGLGIRVVAETELYSVSHSGGSISSLLLRPSQQDASISAPSTSMIAAAAAEGDKNNSNNGGGGEDSKGDGEKGGEKEKEGGGGGGSGGEGGFGGDDKFFVIRCHALLGCGAEDIDPLMFAAILKNSLVFDGKLVVDSSFKTTNPFVFAAGRAVKFSRKYGPTLPVGDCDAGEVGMKLAHSVLSTVFPPFADQLAQQDFPAFTAAAALAATEARTAKGGGDGSSNANGLKASEMVSGERLDEQNDEESSNEEKLLRKGLNSTSFNKNKSEQDAVGAELAALGLGTAPKSVYGQLPGGLHYFQTARPRLCPIPNPRVLVTNHNGRYCRLVFDNLDVLQSISYLGEDLMAFQPFARLIGLPSAYLNRILFRYYNGQIEDLLFFLQGTWAAALYHERFEELRQALKLVLLESLSNGGQEGSGDFNNGDEGENDLTESESGGLGLEALIDYAIKPGANRLNADVFEKLSRKLPTELRELIQIQLLQFLHSYSHHLPQYVVHPSV